MTRAPAPRPQAERVGAPQAGVGEAKPSPEAPARPVQPGPRRALPAGALEPHLAHPQRPPWELERPHPPPPREARGWRGVRCARAPAGGAQVAIVANPGRCPPEGPGTAARARGDPGLWERGPPNSTAPAPACGGFGEEGPARSGTVTQPQRNRRVGTCRPGGRGRRRPRYGLAPPGPASHAPRAPPCAARPAPRRPPGRSRLAGAPAAAESGEVSAAARYRRRWGPGWRCGFGAGRGRAV